MAARQQAYVQQSNGWDKWRRMSQYNGMLNYSWKHNSSPKISNVNTETLVNKNIKTIPHSLFYNLQLQMTNDTFW